MEFWELPDEELWGQLDASLLEDEFRASEATERRALIASIPPGACAAIARTFVEAALTAQAMSQMIAEMAQSMGVFSELEAPSEPRPARFPSSQPRTLHLALQTNARPVQNCRAARREWRKQRRG